LNSQASVSEQNHSGILKAEKPLDKSFYSAKSRKLSILARACQVIEPLASGDEANISIAPVNF
jgi:hypothetical protein